MEMWVWVWLGLDAILIVAEIFTAGFFMLPFGIGAAVAAGASWLKLDLGWQWAAFLAVSAVLLFSLRKFSDRVTHEPPERMGADRLIGQEGRVIEDVEPAPGPGRVRVEREEWIADSAGREVIPAGTRVIVEKIVGTHLIVRPVETVSDEKE
jgi:membrane protein implicated in regulation of membrane protease activity